MVERGGSVGVVIFLTFVSDMTIYCSTLRSSNIRLIVDKPVLYLLVNLFPFSSFFPLFTSCLITFSSDL